MPPATVKPVRYAFVGLGYISQKLYRAEEPFR